MASARYGYMTVSPTDRANLKRPHSELLAPAFSAAGTPRAKPAPSPSNGAPPSYTVPASDDPQIFTSSPIHDRKSTFVGHFSPTLPPKDLQSHPSLSSADHKMLAYRISSSSPLSVSAPKKVKVTQSTLPYSKGIGTLQTGQDDDGENYGGKRVMSVLMDEKVEGSCVVARWYGGVMLGPVRFKHIEDAARGAIRAWKEARDRPAASAVVSDKSVDEGGETEEEECVRLAEELRARDESIASLRTLLKSKKTLLAQLEGGDGGRAEGTVEASPVKRLDYGGMPIERLRGLDKARDNTVAFLLKQIDGVEEKIESWTALEDAVDDLDGGGESAGVKPTPVGTKARGP